jgi:uroporphyrinogen decarboxylase
MKITGKERFPATVTREIISKVNELKEVFPTGLIISPSHEAILADIPPVNIEALFKEIS